MSIKSRINRIAAAKLQMINAVMVSLLFPHSNSQVLASRIQPQRPSHKGLTVSTGFPKTRP